MGVDFEELKCKSCGNHCVFCFVDQNPPSVRETLLFKDEDYRYSFMYGNYVTLTNTSQRDLERIVEQRLSPLYISVHAMDDNVRRRMLGLRGRGRLREKLNFLAENGIEMHAQIVLVPGWNDGAILEHSISELLKLYPAVQTVAIVPVGLTGHRQGLPELQPVQPEDARGLVNWRRLIAMSNKAKYGTHFIYLADELYLLAGEPFPPAEDYDDYAQIENGVGMTRQFLDDLEREIPDWPDSIPETRMAWVTGELAAPILEKYLLPPLNAISGMTAEVLPVKNNFFGGHVTVSGLLTGQDIAAALQGSNYDVAVLPPNCLNYDDLFLDDWTPAQVEAGTAPLVHFLSDFHTILKEIS